MPWLSNCFVKRRDFWLPLASTARCHRLRMFELMTSTHLRLDVVSIKAGSGRFWLVGWTPPTSLPLPRHPTCRENHAKRQTRCPLNALPSFEYWNKPAPAEQKVGFSRRKWFLCRGSRPLIGYGNVPAGRGCVFSKDAPIPLFYRTSGVECTPVLTNTDSVYLIRPWHILNFLTTY